MSDDFERLKTIGAQKIHEKTHISRAHVQAILHESFEEMNSVQLLGFISILEREYSLDLSDLKQKAKEYFKNSSSLIQTTDSVKIFKASDNKKNLIWYIVVIVLIIASALFFTMKKPQNEVSGIDNSAIEDAKNSIAATKEDKNSSQESVVISTPENKQESHKETKTAENQEGAVATNQENNIVQNGDENITATQEDADVSKASFKIIPSSRVWLGYIDLGNHRKYQTTFSDELILDPKKDWLLAFGHGHISIDINGVVTKFKNPKNMRFSYINSELKEIDLEEFKSLNKGSRW